MTLTINGIQVDIQAAIVIGSQYGDQVSFQHIYYSRVTPGTDIHASANNRTTLCSRRPCQNGGLCVVTSSTTYQCLCTAGWGGKKINFFRIEKVMNLRYVLIYWKV